jgi:multidrug transporter EmrE-like cation transporter
MVAAATIVCAAAQILMKLGADYARVHPGLIGLIGDIPLVAGYALYALMTVLIVVAFKDGELSVLYPIISLSYVWVTALSYFIFHDSLNTWKMTGLGFIIGGVAVIGRGSKS